jgi:hypothetical protein
MRFAAACISNSGPRSLGKCDSSVKRIAAMLAVHTTCRHILAAVRLRLPRNTTPTVAQTTNSPQLINVPASGTIWRFTSAFNSSLPQDGRQKHRLDSRAAKQRGIQGQLDDAVLAGARVAHVDIVGVANPRAPHKLHLRRTLRDDRVENPLWIFPDRLRGLRVLPSYGAVLE